MHGLRTFAFLGVAVLASGCSRYGAAPDEDPKPQPVVQRAADKKPNAKRPDPKPKTDDEPLIKRTFLNPDSPMARAAKFPGRSPETAAQQVLANVGEAMDFGPTLVVWMLDRSDSSFGMLTSVLSEVESFYTRLANHEKRNKLKSVVMTFAADVRFLLEEPTDDPQKVRAAFGEFRRGDRTGKEMVFTALRQARDQFLSYRTEKRFHVMFVIVTDEAGDDARVVDEIISDINKHSLAVYVIGAPAPFGRTVAAKGKEPSMRQGPESCYSERLKLAFWGDPFGLNLMDSGFGPFHLERVCRAGGGEYLAIRPDSGGSFYSSLDTRWPNPHALRFDPNVMRKYAPSYGSDDDYKKLLSENSARAALHEVAKLSLGEILAYPPVEFAKRNVAQMARDLTEAQKAAAKLEPQIAKFYDLLKSGEGDRNKLTRPRWQAGFDLAMGRVTAAKARIEGYNAMLGVLKRGKKFESETSNRWELVTADVTEEAGGAIRRFGTQARMYLKRVVDQHPNTPWAIIAERELKNPVGWKWVERGQ